jgi:hypothetical protein
MACAQFSDTMGLSKTVSAGPVGPPGPPSLLIPSEEPEQVLIIVFMRSSLSPV